MPAAYLRSPNRRLLAWRLNGVNSTVGVAQTLWGGIPSRTLRAGHDTVSLVFS